MGEELSQRVVQKYVYQRITDEMKAASSWSWKRKWMKTFNPDEGPTLGWLKG